MQPTTVNPASTEKSDTETLLHRIIAAVEKDRSRGRLELAVAIILSLATLASTWCGYQASAWGGVRSNKQAAADTAERQAAEDTIVGLQLRTFDLLEVRDYWFALRQKDTESRDTIFLHMRPQLRKAIEASLAAGVLQNPELPGPLQRPEYILTEEVNAKRLRVEAGELHTAAQKAGHASSNYVSLTLMFASVLFFGGITGTFTVRRVRVGLGGIALVLFLFTVAMLIGLPVCKG
jgi:hypothetical protein